MRHLAPKGFSQTCQTSSQRMSTATSSKHSQLENNPWRPWICYNRKAARCNSHKCRLVLANNNLVPLRAEAKCHLCGIIQNKLQVTFFPAVTGKAESPHQPCCSTRLQDAALGQELQFPALSSAPSLHQQWYCTIKVYLLQTRFNPFSSGITVQQFFT